MDERHANEQYFFDKSTLSHLTTFLSQWDSPCCLCAPLLGQALTEAGQNVAVLDIDERFESLPGYRRFDIARPEWLGEAFDIIVCDPTFFNLSLSQLFAAVRMISRNDFRQPLLISYLARRSSAITGTFDPFGLKPTGWFPSYQTVQKCERNDIEFFGNLKEEAVRRLRSD